MSFLSKFRAGYNRQVGAGETRQSPATSTSGRRAGMAVATPNVRLSNGLKDFLWHLEGVECGKLLDLGPVWQATVSFFVGRGFKAYTEDLLLAWKEFLAAEEDRVRALPPDEDAAAILPAERAERFLRSNLQYPRETFDAVLAWDLLDYLDAELVTRVAERLVELLKRSGVVLAIFHPAERGKPDTFHRYRVLDRQSLGIIPSPTLVPAQRTFQNREILNLFSRFHSSKTYVGRDQLREGLFIK